jgi:hypothetical protein
MAKKPPLGEHECKCGRRLIFERDPRGKLITKHELPMCPAYRKLIADGGSNVKLLNAAEYIPPRKRRP